MLPLSTKTAQKVDSDMYFDYLKIKIGKYGALLFFPLIVIALIMVIIGITPFYYIVVFVPILYILDYYNRKRYDFAKTLSQKIFNEYKQPFQRKWCCEVIAMDLVGQIRVPLSTDWSNAEKMLCHFLPHIFTVDNQKKKAESAFLNLLALLELNKAFVMKSQIDMYSESSNSFRFAMARLEEVEPHRKILLNVGYILVLMQAIADLNGGNFESFDEDELEEFFDNWDSVTWSIEPLLNPLPKSLNDREFAMENYSDEGFKQLVFAFAEYCDAPFPKKEKVSIISKRLIEKRGNIIPPENDKTEDYEF